MSQFIRIQPNTLILVQALSQNFEKQLLASSCLSVRPSGRMKHAFLWSLIFGYFSKKKTVQKIQVSLKYDNDNRYFKWRPPDICGPISFISY